MALGHSRRRRGSVSGTGCWGGSGGAAPELAPLSAAAALSCLPTHPLQGQADLKS